jgi:hypothetical protein
MDRPDQPAELNVGHEELDRLEGFVGAGTIVEEKEDTGRYLDHEQEEGHPAQVVPYRVSMDRDFLLLRHPAQNRQAQAVLEPCAEPADHPHPVTHALQVRFRSIRCPSTLPLKFPC